MVKLAENAGFGFSKIESNWIEYNNTKPEYIVDFDSIMLRMNMEGFKEKTSEKTSEKILKLIKVNKQITIDELSVKIGITTRSIEL